MAVNHVYQYSTASALMAGIASNGIPLSDLLSHGSHGLGTMAQINGEVVVVDSTAYHLQSDGSVRIVEGHEQLPFAVVTPFNAMQNKKADRFPAGLHNKSAILDCLVKLYSSGITNRFAFFLLPDTTHFNHITVRVVRGQKYRGQPLSELGDSQKVDTYHNIRGSIVGFWTPAFMDGVSIGGLHMHFLSSDRTYGGHVLELQTQEEVTLTAAVLNALELELPNNTEFDRASLGSGGGGGEELRKVEG